MEDVRFVLRQQHWDAITDDECKMVLRKMRPIAASFLQGRPVADCMAEEDGSFDVPHLQAIDNREEFNKALLGLVEEKAKAALPSFMDALLRTGQPRLYDILLTELQRSAAAVFPCLAKPVQLSTLAVTSASGEGYAMHGRQESAAGQLMLAGKPMLDVQLTADDRLLVMCPVCENIMTDPVLLPCLHSCCRACVECDEKSSASAARGWRSASSDNEHWSDPIPLHIADAERDWPAALSSTELQLPRAAISEQKELPMPQDDASDVGDSLADGQQALPSLVSGSNAEGAAEGTVAIRSTVSRCQSAGNDAEGAAEGAVAIRSRDSRCQAAAFCRLCRRSLQAADGHLPNRLVAMHIAQLAERDGGKACRRCHERGYEYKESTVRCLNCSTFMCSDCAADHDSFLKNHVVVSCQTYFASSGDESGSSASENDAIIRSPPVACVVHGNAMDVYCGDCRKLICAEYLKRKCLMEAHRGVEPLEVLAARARTEIDSRVNSLWPAAMREGTAEGSVLPSAAIALLGSAESTGKTLSASLQLLKRSLVEPLESGKRALLEAIEVQHEAARDRVVEYCARLDTQARQMRARVGGAVSYCRQLIRLGDDVCIAEQHATAVACLSRLYDETVSGDSDGERSEIDDAGALAICNDYLVIERRPLTDDCQAFIAELIGKPKIAAAGQPLRLHTVLAMASDGAAQLVRQMDGVSESAKEKEVSDGDVAKVTTERDDLQTPTGDIAGSRADKAKESTGLSEEHDSDAFRQLRERYADIVDQNNELQVRLEKAEERATQLETDLRAGRATIRRLDRELTELREAKSHVDYELKMLRRDSAKMAGAFEQSSEAVAAALSDAASRARVGPFVAHASNVNVLSLAHPAANVAGWRWPSQPAGVGSVPQQAGSRFLLQPRHGAPGGRGLLTSTGLQQLPAHSFVPLPEAAVPTGQYSLLRPIASLAVSEGSGYVSARHSYADEGDAKQHQSFSSSSSMPVRSKLSSTSEASDKQVLAIDPSNYYPLLQEIRWCNSDGSQVEFNLKLMWMERLDVKCFDVALIDGSVFAMASGKGLRLYESVGRRELCQVNDHQAYRCVAAVPNATADSRRSRSVRSTLDGTKLVAGNKSAKRLELLVLGDSPPIVSCIVASVLLEGHLPWCVAVDRAGRTAAVSSGRILRTVPLHGSSERSQFKLDFTISALAYGYQVLIIGSSEKQSGRYALEARDANDVNRELWKVWLDEAVSGMRCVGDRQCYVLLARSRSLRIISAADGEQHADVTLGSLLPPAAIDAYDQSLVFLLGDAVLASFEMHSIQQHAEKC